MDLDGLHLLGPNGDTKQIVVEGGPFVNVTAASIQGVSAENLSLGSTPDCGEFGRQRRGKFFTAASILGTGIWHRNPWSDMPPGPHSPLRRRLRPLVRPFCFLIYKH